VTATAALALRRQASIAIRRNLRPRRVGPGIESGFWPLSVRSPRLFVIFAGTRFVENLSKTCGQFFRPLALDFP